MRKSRYIKFALVLVVLLLGLILLAGHLSGLRCLDVPYLAPFHSSGGESILRGRVAADAFRNARLHPKDRRRTQ